MQIHSIIQFHFQLENEAEIFYQSFFPEFSDLPMKRSKWHFDPIQNNSKDISIQIDSEDATAFRATVNSLIQFSNIIEKTILIADKYY